MNLIPFHEDKRHKDRARTPCAPRRPAKCPPYHVQQRIIALFGWLAISLALIATTAAAEPASAVPPTNALATGSNPGAATNALTKASDSANNASQTTETNPAPTLDGKYKLVIGDRLSFRILEDEDDPKPLVVTDSGDLDVPYIGRVPAENKTCQQLGAEIKTMLEKDYYYRATVSLAVDSMMKNHGKVYLVGEVRLPGMVEIPSDETLKLSQAILRAGSFTDYADRRHVTVTRITGQGKDDKKTFKVDVEAIFDKGKVETDLILEPDDQILVPANLFRF